MKIQTFKTVLLFSAAFGLLFSALVWPIDEGELLDPDRAFPLDARMQGQDAVLRWRVADGYYLYRDRIQARSLSDAVGVDGLSLPQGTLKNDPIFGEVYILRGTVEARVAVQGKPGPFELQVDHQGCADVGVCYPPDRKNLQLELPPSKTAAAQPLNQANPLKALGAFVADGGNSSCRFFRSGG